MSARHGRKFGRKINSYFFIPDPVPYVSSPTISSSSSLVSFIPAIVSFLAEDVEAGFMDSAIVLSKEYMYFKTLRVRYALYAWSVHTQFIVVPLSVRCRYAVVVCTVQGW